MEWKIYAENEPADYASDFFKKKIAAYPIVETDVESPQIKHRISDRLYENGSMSFPRYRTGDKVFLLGNPKGNDVP